MALVVQCQGNKVSSIAMALVRNVYGSITTALAVMILSVGCRISTASTCHEMSQQ